MSPKTQIERLAVIEEQIKTLQADITELRDNHLFHIQAKLEGLENFKTQVIAYASVGAFGGSILVQIALKFIN